MYGTFADIYDVLMDEVDYCSWAQYLCDTLSGLGVPRGARVCEVCCGTGSLTLPLSQAGYRMTGLDLSGAMLEKAMAKCRAHGQMIPFVKGDMRSFRLPRPGDAVLATCDGVNYLLTQQDLDRFLSHAYAALRPGGALVFDVSAPDKLTRVLGSNTLTATEENYAYIWHNLLHGGTQTVDMRLTLFVRENVGEHFLRYEEEQTQRIWQEQDLLKALERAGFQNASRDKNAPVFAPDDQRWHFTALRPKADPSGKDFS